MGFSEAAVASFGFAEAAEASFWVFTSAVAGGGAVAVAVVAVACGELLDSSETEALGQIKSDFPLELITVLNRVFEEEEEEEYERFCSRVDDLRRKIIVLDLCLTVPEQLVEEEDGKLEIPIAAMPV